ncbi:MAG: hypothetical protein U0326_19325 [Polyangiales bacterium]
MIRYERPSIPERFDALTKDARDAIEALVARGTPPKHGDFKSTWGSLKGPLVERQHGKCGYCESRIDGHAWEEVEHYRPKSALSALPPLTLPLHQHVSGPRARGSAIALGDRGYWWLAYVWENWLLACEHCNGWFKGTLFPIRESPRPSLIPGAEKLETPLLLNPFDTSIDPLDHLRFDWDGTVAPIGNSVHGAETIRTCGLHREKLVRDRRELASLIRELLDEYRRAQTRADQRRPLHAIIDRGRAERPFAGAARSLTSQWFGCHWRRLWPT